MAPNTPSASTSIPIEKPCPIGADEPRVADQADPLADRRADHMGAHVGVDGRRRCRQTVHAEQVHAVHRRRHPRRRPDGFTGHDRHPQPHPRDRRAVERLGVAAQLGPGAEEPGHAGEVPGARQLFGSRERPDQLVVVDGRHRDLAVGQILVPDAQRAGPHTLVLGGAHDRVDDLDDLALPDHHVIDPQRLADGDRPDEVDGEPAQAHRCQRRDVLQDVAEQGQHRTAGLCAGAPRTLRGHRSDERVVLTPVQRLFIGHRRAPRSARRVVGSNLFAASERRAVAGFERTSMNGLSSVRRGCRA